MNFAPFTGPGSTDLRRKFWAQAMAAVESSRKREGRNVEVSEHDGKGTFINVADTSERRGQAAPSDCPPANPCTLDLTFTSTPYNVSQAGLSINPNVCSEFGWNGIWETNCVVNDCGQATKYCTSEVSCVCGARFDWNEIVGTAIDFSYVRIVLNKIVGDPILADGWYLWASAHMEDGTNSCYWESVICPSFPCTCVYLGGLDVFDTELIVSIPMTEDPSFPCAGDGTLDLHFYPC